MSQISGPLSANHNRIDFSCGKELLDIYFHKQVNQDIKRKLSACFVIADQNQIKGYYTLSNSSIPLEFIPEALQKKLPNSYHSIPTILLGRLAIDQKFKGKGIGKLLLIDALKRCHDTSKSIASFAVIVDPIDIEAEAFYEKFGFIRLPVSGKMFLPMKTINQLFE